MQRRHPRAPVSLWARHVGDAPPAVNQHVSNLSRGGLFLDGCAPLPLGAEVELDLVLGDRLARVRGRVVHATRGEDAIGMGVRLDDVASEDLASIESYLRDRASAVTFA